MFLYYTATLFQNNLVRKQAEKPPTPLLVWELIWKGI